MYVMHVNFQNFKNKLNLQTKMLLFMNALCSIKPNIARDNGVVMVVNSLKESNNFMRIKRLIRNYIHGDVLIVTLICAKIAFFYLKLIEKYLNYLLLDRFIF